MSAALTLAGVRTGGPDGAGALTWVLALAVAVAVTRAVGPRRPRRPAFWLAGTACCAVVPWTWAAVALTASEEHPESGWVWVAYVGLTPHGWVLLAPVVLVGAVVTAVLARYDD